MQETAKGTVLLSRGDLGVTSCFKTKTVGGVTQCFHGSGFISGCTESCAYASFPEYDRLKLGCEFVVSGSVLDLEDGSPLAGKPLHWILPSRKRYITRTGVAGGFEIVLAPEASGADREPCRVSFKLGILETDDSDEAVTLVTDFSKEFRATNAACLPTPIDPVNAG